MREWLQDGLAVGIVVVVIELIRTIFRIRLIRSGSIEEVLGNGFEVTIFQTKLGTYIASASGENSDNRVVSYAVKGCFDIDTAFAELARKVQRGESECSFSL